MALVKKQARAGWIKAAAELMSSNPGAARRAVHSERDLALQLPLTKRASSLHKVEYRAWLTSVTYPRSEDRKITKARVQFARASNFAEARIFNMNKFFPGNTNSKAFTRSENLQFASGWPH